MKPDGAAADRMLSGLRDRLATNGAEGGHEENEGGYGESEGGYGEPAPKKPVRDGDDNTVTGQLDGKTCIATAAGPYLFIAVGSDPAGVRDQILAAAQPFSRPSTADTATAAIGRPAPLQPGAARFADVPGSGLITPTDIETYTDDLYEKIDGKESMFRSFNFVELRFGRYQYPDREETFDVYIFDQGEPANALGIYMAERSLTPSFIPVGREGYVSGYSAYFWKDNYYVNVLGPEEGDDETTGRSRSIASAIADTIDDAGEPFWAESLLPADDRVPQSFSYKATSALGYEFLNRMFFADYKTGDVTYQVFLIREDSPAAARRVFDEYAEATAKYDKIVSREPTDGGETLIGEGFDFSAVFCRGAYFGGVTQCADQKLAVERAAALRARLAEPAATGG
jgi:hypothetical protein